jgi:hypothetical protein
MKSTKNPGPDRQTSTTSKMWEFYHRDKLLNFLSVAATTHFEKTCHSERMRLPACPDQSGASDGKNPLDKATLVVESICYNAVSCVIPRMVFSTLFSVLLMPSRKGSLWGKYQKPRLRIKSSRAKPPARLSRPVGGHWREGSHWMSNYLLRGVIWSFGILRDSSRLYYSCWFIAKTLHHSMLFPIFVYHVVRGEDHFTEYLEAGRPAGTA